MINSYVVQITEIDDVGDALRQLDEKMSGIALLTNTIGIVEANEEFLSSGIYKALTEALSFPTAGATTLFQNANGMCESFALSILILTSDDCVFACGASDCLPESGSIHDISQTCYHKVRGQIPKDAALALLYTPYSSNRIASEFINPIAETNEKMPIFGKVANDNIVDITTNNSRTLYCGEYYNDRFVLVLISGDIKPEFYIASVTEESIIMPRIGEITAVDKNKLLEVNNINAIEFFEHMDILVSGKNNAGLLTSTFVIDTKIDDIIISRTPVLIDEDGIYCGGALQVGEMISISFSTKEVVVETASELLKKIRDKHSGGIAVIYSCVGRRYGLVRESHKEFELISEILGDNFTYLAGYANGEICPTSVTESKANNQEHNQTLIACVF